jgi:diaminopimelate decarboxylase
MAPDLPASVVAAVRSRARPVCAYIYDRAVLRTTANAVRAALPAGASLLYAMKANSHPEVLAALAAVVDGFEVASGGELDAALTAGAGVLAFGGPGKTEAELVDAVRAGATIHIESELEAYRLADLARAGHRVRAALRVNRPGITLPGSHRMAGVPTQFGIDEPQLPQVAAVAAAAGLDVIGFHLHAVSNNLDAHAHAAFVRDAVQWAVGAASRLGIALRYVNVGGGFGVDYLTGLRMDLTALAAGLEDPPPGVELTFEPGRFLVAGAGWYAAEVLDVKRNQGRCFAIVRGGTHHFRLPAAWGYSHPFAVVPNDDWRPAYPRPAAVGEPITVAGELCTPRDVMATEVMVDQLRVGDVLVFPDAGGYGWDISHHEFLRHPYPEMVFI